ncbi:MAG: menaquinone-dependent protoporphyrinogen IX dehydrogenase [Candidatus Methylumidiphilus sp.]
MTSIAIIYSSTDGHTLHICERLREVIEGQGQQVGIVPIADAAGLDLAAFDKIVIGASIRYGRHNPQVAAFIRANQAILDSKPNAFFSVNVVARKPEKSQPDSNPYLRKFLRQITWKPKALAVFAGKLDYPRYNPFDRFMIRLIMWITKGPTDPKAVIEFTDWRQVEAFGRLVADM